MALAIADALDGEVRHVRTSPPEEMSQDQERSGMISKFLQVQMDYIFFFYGLGFILLAAATWALRRTEEQEMPWKWLGLFGLAHGLNEWLDMLVFSLMDSSAFAVVRLIVMATSFLFLIEFGRSGSAAVHGKRPGRWVFIPLLSLAGLGAFAGISGLNASVRYALGLTGGLWTAVALWQHRHAAHPGSRPLLLAALSMGFYGLVSGIVVPQAPFFPAAFLNHASFFAFTGFPIQLLRGILACVVAAAIWQYYVAWRRTAFKGIISPAAFRYEVWTSAVITATLAAGWLMTCSLGRFGQQRDGEQYNHELKLVQATFEASVETADRLVKTSTASPNLRIMGTQSRRDVAAINETLDRYARVIPNSICYVLDSSGKTLASSNRDTPESFVGHSYAVRPYFKKAMEGLQGSYVAVGLTSKAPGYYSSFPVRDAAGEIVGVTVVKINLDKLLIASYRGNYGFLVDPNGIILSSTHPDFLLRTLWPISEEARRGLTQSEQYPALPEPAVLPAHSVPGTLFSFRGAYLQTFQQTTSVEGLSFVILGSMNSWKMSRLVGILITLLATVLLVVFFVTQQKKSESSARIAASERLYRTLVEGSPNWIGLFDRDGRCVAVNGNGLAAMGRTEAEVHGMRFPEIWWKEAGSTLEDYVSRVLHGERVSFEADQYQPDGSYMTWHAVLNPICDQDGTVGSFVGIANDISARKQAEAMLASINRQNELLLSCAGDGIFGLDLEGRTIFANPAAVHLLGYKPEEMIGLVQHDLIHHTREDGSSYQREECPIHSTFKDGQVHHGETEVFWRKDGKTFPVDYTSTPVRDENGVLQGAVVVFSDITERKRAEAERIQIEQRLQMLAKAESLGRMAGSIAHHFNNKLGAVMGNLELALYKLPQESDARASICNSMKASRQAAEISRLMLAYLGQTIGRKEPLDLVEAIRETLPLLGASTSQHVHLKTELPLWVPIILGDSVHIKQILTNLVSNAAEAIGQNEGYITVAIQVRAAAEIQGLRFSPLNWEPTEEQYVCLSVSDTGCGMDEATLEKVFDPFFSTKFTGRGLGLPVLLGLVRAHDGAIAVESSPGRGAMFRVFFPLHTSEAVPSRKEEPFVSRPMEDGGLVLVVDDEPMVRNMAESMLKCMAYEVIVACDGYEAVAIFSARKDEINFVLLDLSMPGIDGWETLGQLRSLRPDIPVVIASGYDEAQVMQGDHPHRPQAFIHKPYLVPDLQTAIDMALKKPVSTR